MLDGFGCLIHVIWALSSLLLSLGINRRHYYEFGQVFFYIRIIKWILVREEVDCKEEEEDKENLVFYKVVSNIHEDDVQSLFLHLVLDRHLVDDLISSVQDADVFFCKVKHSIWAMNPVGWPIDASENDWADLVVSSAFYNISTADDAWDLALASEGPALPHPLLSEIFIISQSNLILDLLIERSLPRQPPGSHSPSLSSS